MSIIRDSYSGFPVFHFLPYVIHKMKSSIRLLCALSVLTCLTPTACGTIIVTYQGGTVDAGGTGFLDVMISSDAAPGSPDNVDLFSLQFRITALGTGNLEFVNPQSEFQLFNDSSYVLYQDSVGELNPGISTVSTFLNPNDTLDALDATTSFLGKDLNTASGLKRLFRLDLSAVGASMGDQFGVQLIESGTQFSDLNSNLYVSTPAPIPGNPLQLDSASFNSFTVTAVPEPATGGLLLCGALAAYWKRRRSLCRSSVQAG